MQPKPLIEIDTRVLKEDYCNYDLVARCWNDEYRGRVWKNKDRVADFEGTDLDDIMVELRAIVDGIQQEKRRERGKRKPSTTEIAEALAGIEPKLSRQQRAMLSVHAKAPLQRVMMRSMIRLGDYATAELAFADYVQVARRLSDELAYSPSGRRKDVYQGSALLFSEEIVIDSVGAETVLTLRQEVAKAVETLKW
jgi:hypothetical protein